MKNNIIKNKYGFSLLELSIVISIIGVIAYFAFSATTEGVENAKRNQTENKMFLINNAIEAFLLLNNRLPCPADATLPINDANLGVENCSGSVSRTVTILPSVTPSINDSIVIGGSIPYSSLLLPKDIIFDGWGNKFSYAVSHGLANSSISNAFDSENSGILKIYSWNNNLITDQAAYVLISHGNSGKGAWNKQGNMNNVGSNTKKISNSYSSSPSNWDEIFTLNLSSHFYYNATNWPNFDDIVYYIDKPNLLYKLGFSISGKISNVTTYSICSNAYEAIASNNSSTTSANKLCNGTGGLSTGTLSHAYCNEYLSILAAEVKKRCIPRSQE